MVKYNDVIAVDPGDVHVGVAVFDGKLKSVRATELPAVSAVRTLVELIRALQSEGRHVYVVIENFVLYPGKAMAQSWSPMRTAKMIGALQWLCENQLFVSCTIQDATIKLPTRAQMKARGVGIASRKSGHADDAVLHLWHFLLRREMVDLDIEAVGSRSHLHCNGYSPLGRPPKAWAERKAKLAAEPAAEELTV